MQDMEKAVGSARAILESITDAFYLINRHWQFTYVNQQAGQLLERAPEDLLGKNLWEQYPGLIGTELESVYRKVLAEGISGSCTFYFPDHQRWYEAHCYPSPQGISVYFRNATERVMAEDKLRESERHFRNMADAIPQIVWITDAQGQAQFFNQQWYAYTGTLPHLNDAGQVSADHVHPDDHVATMNAWEAAKRDGTTFKIEHRIRSAAGEYRWFLVRAEPYRDPATGSIVRWYGTSTDIHDKRMTEKALQDEEERYRTLVTATAQIVWRVEPNGEALADSPSWRAFTGQTYEEWKNFGWTAALHPEDAPHIVAVWTQCLTAATIFEEEYRLRRFDGEYRWTLVRAVPILNADRSIREWIGTNTDITEKKQADTALHLSQERLRLATEGGQIGIWDWDMQTGEVDWSPEACKVFGFNENKPGDLVGAFKGLVHPEDILSLKQTIDTAVKSKPGYAADFRIVRPDRSIRWVSNWANIYRDAAGKAVRAVGTVLDITERKNAEAVLQEQDRRKDEFLAMLAHELRNPLAPIGAAAELMEMMPQLDADRVKQTSRIISRQVRHMAGLVDDLLDVSRVTRGMVELDNKALDIKRVVYDALEQVEPLIEAKRHQVTVELAPDTIFVKGDQKRLVQILTNILNNAAKYTPEGGDIHIKMDVSENKICLCIGDNGIGVAPELQASIFDLFSQAERTSDRSQGGLGIGLALVKRLVELHGGTVVCESEGLGKGSRFKVSLPRLGKPMENMKNPEGIREKPSAGRRLSVLVVDDNLDAADMLSLYLQAGGHEVATEYHPLRALQRANQKAPDVYVLDIGLPQIDGYELARQLKSDPKTARAVFVAVTGYGQERDRSNSLDAGFDYHLVKPINASQLLALMAEIGKQ